MRRRWAFIVMGSLAMIACEQPVSTARATSRLTSAQTVVVDQRDETATRFQITFDADLAPAGRYLLFSSDVPPTAVENASDMDAHTSCTQAEGCIVDGLGRLESIARNGGPAPLHLTGEIDRNGGSLEGLRWFTVVRLDSSSDAVDATIRVDMEAAAGGCGAPAPPALEVHDL